MKAKVSQRRAVPTLSGTTCRLARVREGKLPEPGCLMMTDASKFQTVPSCEFYQDVGCVNQTSERESYLQRKSYLPILLGTVLLLFIGVSAVPCCGTHESHTQ